MTRAPKRTPAETDAIRRKAIADHLQREQQVRIIRAVKHAPKKRTEREVFEAWAYRAGFPLDSFSGQSKRKIYEHLGTEHAWLAWQARARRGRK